MPTPVVPHDQRLARRLVTPLAAWGVTPNQVTGLTLALAAIGGVLLATGEAVGVALGATAFVAGRFLDHVDGELARVTGAGSRLGYYLDYCAGSLSYAILFAATGAGLARGALGDWALGLGLVGALAALASMPLNLLLDRQAGFTDGEAIGYPAAGGFELEDGIYLIAPAAWMGWLAPFFVAAGLGAAVYLLWTGMQVVRGARARSKRGRDGPSATTR